MTQDGKVGKRFEDIVLLLPDGAYGREENGMKVRGRAV